MPFPVAYDGVRHDAPPSLAAAVFAAARSGRRPDVFVVRAAREGALSRDEAVGLCAALIQTQEPAAVAAGARAAAGVGDGALLRLLVVAAGSLDVGVLLTADADGRSVEDWLLDAAVALLGDEPDVRRALLDLLRPAGLVAHEVRVLALRGDADEIAAELPAALLEGLPPGAADPVARGLLRGGDVALALIAAVEPLSVADRRAAWAAAARHGAHRDHPDLEARWVGGSPSE